MKVGVAGNLLNLVWSHLMNEVTKYEANTHKLLKVEC